MNCIIIDNAKQKYGFAKSFQSSSAYVGDGMNRSGRTASSPTGEEDASYSSAYAYGSPRSTSFSNQNWVSQADESEERNASRKKVSKAPASENQSGYFGFGFLFLAIIILAVGVLLGLYFLKLEV